MNILIPTDFTPSSIKIALAAAKAQQQKVNVILFHAFDLPFYYSDLIRTQPPFVELMNEELRQACKQLKDQHPDWIGHIHVRCMQGSSNALFRNFLEANQIDMIAVPPGYRYQRIHKDSLNPMPFFKRGRVPVWQASSIELEPTPFTLQRKQAYKMAAAS